MKLIKIEFLMLLLVAVLTSCSSVKETKPERAVASNSNSASSHVGTVDTNSNVQQTFSNILTEEEKTRFLTDAKATLKPWVDGAKLVASKTNDEDAKIYIDVLDNSIYVHPVKHPSAGDMIVVEPLNDVKDEKKPWIRLLGIQSDFKPPTPKWEQITLPLKQSLTASYYDEVEMLITSARPIQNPVLAGLVMLHEMCHASQNATMEPSLRKHQYFTQMREISAYEYEFELMDKLNNPVVKTLTDEYRLKYAQSGRAGVDPNFNDPRLEQAYGNLNSLEEKQLAVTLIMFKAYFQYAESLGEETAMSTKINFMMSQGYR